MKLIDDEKKFTFSLSLYTQKLRQMSSTDTPLNTVKLLQDKQKELQKPYIVLTGGGQQQQHKSSTSTSSSTQISKK